MFGAVPPLILLVMLSVLSYYTLQSLLTAIALVDKTHGSIEQAKELERSALRMQSGIWGYLVTGDERFLDDYKGGEEKFNQVMKRLKSTMSIESQRDILNATNGIIQEWKKKAVKPGLQIRETVSAAELMSQLDAFLGMRLDKEYFDKFWAQTSKFVKQETALLKERKKDAHSSGAAMAKILVIGTLAIVILSQLISYLIAGRVSRPVVMAAALAEATSKGNLTGALAVKGKDEVGLLSASLNTMVSGLVDYTNQVRESIAVLSEATSEMSAIAAQLSSDTQQASSGLSETTTTVEQVKQAARVSSEKAKAVAKGAVDAVEVSTAGKKATEETVQGMELIKEQMELTGKTVAKLNEQRQSMQEMIDSVQDIARQSNLLAVNASIEAARAGEHGKGFGVVASEIKDLADQSRQTTDKIRGMLEETGKWINAVVIATEQTSGAVGSGVQLSRVAGDSISLLAKTVEGSSHAASVIVASVEEQFIGIDQVSNAMTLIDKSMQQNSTGAHQLETSVRRLEMLSASLKELVQKYKV